MCVRHFTHRPDDEVEGSVGSLSRFPELFCRTCAAPGAGHRGADFWHGITPSFGLVYGTPSPGDKRPVYERFLWQTIRATTYAKGNGCVSTGNSADLGRTQLASTLVVELGAQYRPAAAGTHVDGALPVKPAPLLGEYTAEVFDGCLASAPAASRRCATRGCMSGSRRHTARLQAAESRAKIAPGNGEELSCRISLRSSHA